MKNFLISNLHKKDVEHFTTNFGLYIRRVIDKPFKKLCNIFTNANIIRQENDFHLTDEEYFSTLNTDYVAPGAYNPKKNKNNIIVERYPELNKDEPYIFVCNHTCPEDIETVLNILDRNAYLILGSIESLKYNPEMYLSWLNGMVPFDIMNKVQRKQVFEKMLRVLKTNSILIFPEGSHNYSPNKLVNNLFDGPINLALRTNRKIVVVTLIKEEENNLSYIDVSNPLDVRNIKVDMNKQFNSDEELEKYYVKSLSLILRDKMATAVYHLISRHVKPLKRDEYVNIEEELRTKKIQDAFDKLKWKRDVFDAEYLTKKTEEERTHEEIIRTLSGLTINTDALKGYNNKHWVLSELNIDNKNVPLQMRNYWLSIEKAKTKKLKRGKI